MYILIIIQLFLNFEFVCIIEKICTIKQSYY